MAVHPQGLAVLAGIIWLGLAVPLFGLAAISLKVGSQSTALFAAMATSGLVVATALMLRPGARPSLIASAFLGVLFAALSGLATWQSMGVFPSQGPTLAYGVVAAIVTVISARPASRRQHDRVPRAQRSRRRSVHDLVLRGVG